MQIQHFRKTLAGYKTDFLTKLQLKIVFFFCILVRFVICCRVLCFVSPEIILRWTSVIPIRWFYRSNLSSCLANIVTGMCFLPTLLFSVILCVCVCSLRSCRTVEKRLCLCLSHTRVAKKAPGWPGEAPGDQLWPRALPSLDEHQNPDDQPEEEVDPHRRLSRITW